MANVEAASGWTEVEPVPLPWQQTPDVSTHAGEFLTSFEY